MIAKGVASNLSPPRDESHNPSHAFQDWFTLSKKLEQLAVKVLSLAPVVKEGSHRDWKTVVRKLLRSTNGLRHKMKRFDADLSSIGATISDIVRVASRSYPSAHHAALDEAHLLLESLQHRQRVYRLIRKLCRSGIKMNPEFDSDPIFKFSEKWHQDFQDVPARIRRERWALVKKKEILSQLSKPQIPNLPIVNLELKQIRYAGECHDVSGDSALLVQGIVDAHPDWFPASKNGFSKPSSTKHSLPDPIKDLIETAKGKGYRFKRNKLHLMP